MGGVLVLLGVVGVVIWAAWQWFEQVQARVAANRPPDWQPAVVPALWAATILGVGAVAAVVLLGSTHHYGGDTNPFRFLWVALAPAAIGPGLALRQTLQARVGARLTLRWFQLATLMTPLAVATCYYLTVADSDLPGPSTDLAFTLIAMTILFGAAVFWLAIPHWLRHLIREQHRAAQRALTALWATLDVGATTDEAARRAPCSPAEAEQVLFDLAAQGAVTRTGGWWHLNPAQRQAAIDAGWLTA